MATVGLSPVVTDELISASADDGNQVAGDGCNLACQVEACGNGRADLGEACDDGNQEVGDGCDACRSERCGNAASTPVRAVTMGIKSIQTRAPARVARRAAVMASHGKI